MVANNKCFKERNNDPDLKLVPTTYPFVTQEKI